MVPLPELADLAFFHGLPDAAVDRLAADAEVRTYEPGEFILHQHDEAHALYLLLSGAVEFMIRFEGVDDLYVGGTSERGALIGWSIRRQPHRYTASVRCTEPSSAIRLPRRTVEGIIADDPRSGCRILEHIALVLTERLDDARGLLGRLPKTATAGGRP